MIIASLKLVSLKSFLLPSPCSIPHSNFSFVQLPPPGLVGLAKYTD